MAGLARSTKRNPNMKISNAFPSNYLKADDLQGGRFTLTIARVTMEQISESESKPVVHFHNTQKGMVLNKTNAMNISILHGEETDGWVGKQVELFTTMVPFGNQTVPAIRITAPPVQQPAQSVPGQQAPVQSPASQPLPDGRPTAPPVSGMGGAVDEDDIPF